MKRKIVFNFLFVITLIIHLSFLDVYSVFALDGNLDTSFTSGTGPNNVVYSTLIQPDGKILIGGYFTSYNGTPRNRIARLNTDGTLDTSFTPGTGADDAGVLAFALQPDGKIIIGGEFTSYNGTPRNRIARLNTDGTLDTSFDPGIGSDNNIYGVAFLSDGKIIIGGGFTSYNGTPRNRIARLNTDGTLDAGFNPGTGADQTVYSTAVQSDGKILIGGYFTSYNGTPRNRIARLNTDGTLDTTFNPSTGANDGGVSNFAFQPDGKIIIGGEFASYNGINTIKYVTRLRLNSNPTDVLLSINTIDENNTPPTTIGTLSTVDIDTEDTHTYTLTCTVPGTDDASFSISTNQLDITVPADFETKASYDVCVRTTDTNGLFFDKNITITVNDITEIVTTVIPPSSSGGNININNSILQPTPQATLSTNPPTVVSPLDGGTLVCNPFKSYLKFNSYKNIVSEVTLWQAYLNKFHNENLSLTGFYDIPTFEAMKRFQSKYKTEVLAPWNLQSATGYTYKTTRAKANQLLGCPEGELLLENGNKVDIK